MSQHTAAPPGTRSYWLDSASVPTFPKLQHDQHVDVLIVGGGNTGLTAAHLLTTAGLRVAVLERERCGQIDTGHTTAHLTMVTDTRLTDLVSRFGRDHAQAVWDAGLAAIARISETVQTHGLDCGFQWLPGYLHAPRGGATTGEISKLKDDAALAAEMGFDATFVENVPAFSVPGIRFDGQARFHPRQYLAGLARLVREAGGSIYEHSAAEEFSSDPISVKVNGHTVTCEHLILATHNPLVGISGIVPATAFQTKLALYTSYVVAGRVPRGTVLDALYWDTNDPYDYMRLDTHRDFDLLIYGGEDHKTGQVRNTVDCYDRLEKKLVSLCPQAEIAYRWSGQIIQTPDGLPYIGEIADHQYAATGFVGNGITFGTLAAMMFTEAVLGRANPWADLFHPSRKAITHGTWEYIKENADYPYYLIRDRFAGVEGRTLRAVKRGSGAVIERDGKKVAAYRDDSGETTLRSATCTHMGCLVAWNDAERTWDCPCHGSRFTPTGDVISGPAETPLPKVE